MLQRLEEEITRERRRKIRKWLCLTPSAHLRSILKSKAIYNNVESYCYLVRNRNKHGRISGFKKICCIFGSEKVRLLIAEADRAFRSIGKKITSGDPDLFVYNENMGD